MGPAMDEVAAGVGTPTEGRERASSSPKSRGGSEHCLRSKDSLAGDTFNRGWFKGYG